MIFFSIGISWAPDTHPSLKVIGETIGDPFLKCFPESGKIRSRSQKRESPGRFVIQEEALSLPLPALAGPSADGVPLNIALKRPVSHMVEIGDFGSL